jgi:protein TonB
MLAYATDRPAARHGSPRALLLVIAGHAVLIALVLTARGEMPGIKKFDPTEVVFIDPVKPPPPPPPTPAPDRPRNDLRSLIDTPPVIVPTPQPRPAPLDDGRALLDLSPGIGNAVVPLPLPEPLRAAILRKAPRFVTRSADIRPPYPEAKRRLEEEASLRLALQIDERGRVVSVDPVGAADPAFLDAARRHILRRWRYQPATEGDRAIPARLVVTLRFELDE